MWLLSFYPGVRYWSTIGRIIRVSSFERIVTNSFDRCSSTKWYVQHPHSWILLYICVSSFFQSLFSLRSFPPLVLAASYCAAKSSQFHSTLLPAIANNVNSGGNLVFLCICPSGALCLVFRLPLFQPDIVSDCSMLSCITNTTLAMPPMRTGGTAMMMQPKAAIYEVSSALLADLLESTLWK